MTESFETYDFAPTPEESGERLDKILTNRLTSLSRVRVQALIKEGHVSVNGKVGKASLKIDATDQISAQLINAILAPDNSIDTLPERIPLEILYEDDQIVVINKAAGMVVHPAAGHHGGTLVNALLSRYPEMAHVGGEGRSGIVHRLDKDTSGVIVAARTEHARLSLVAQFAKRTVEKRYLALIEGHLDAPQGEINAPIDRDPHQRKQMAVVRGGREAVTFYKVLQPYADTTLIECFPKTGRTHQIRVHLAFIHHPIVSDPVYGRRKTAVKLNRFFLHAAGITLTLPVQKTRMTFTAPLPQDLQNVLDSLV